jgi:hypothetical protein
MGLKSRQNTACSLIILPESLRASGTARLELKIYHGLKSFPRALIRAREHSVRAEIPLGSEPGDSAQLGQLAT